MTFTEKPFLLFVPIVFLLWLLCRRRESSDGIPDRGPGGLAPA